MLRYPSYWIQSYVLVVDFHSSMGYQSHEGAQQDLPDYQVHLVVVAALEGQDHAAYCFFHQTLMVCDLVVA
jgi:hypothetical protein